VKKTRHTCKKARFSLALAAIDFAKDQLQTGQLNQCVVKFQQFNKIHHQRKGYFI